MSEKPTKSLVDNLPDGLKKNLSPGEEVISSLNSFVIAERTNYMVLTNIRLIYFDEKHLGRYDFKSLPLQKVLQISAGYLHTCAVLQSGQVMCWGFGSATPVQFEIVTSGMSSVMT